MHASSTTTRPPVAVPCPTWCEEPEGHNYCSIDDDGRHVRYHGRLIGNHSLGVDVQAAGTWQGDRETTAVPSLYVEFNDASVIEGMDAATARELIGLLQRGVDELERISQ